jgi:hypothetical protein
MPEPLLFRIVMGLAWLNLAILAADGMYHVVKAVMNHLARGTGALL